VSEPQDTFEAVRTEKLRAIEALGLDPWGGRFDGHQPIQDVLALPTDVPDDQRPRVRIAGRIVSRREGGKVHFLDVKDWSGRPTSREIKGEREGEIEKVPDLSSRVQIYVGKKEVGETGWQLTQLLDIGDLIGVEGTYGKTRRGEPTVFAESLTILAKSLQPHPDKWGGMQDMEFRLRHRYLDLIYNPDTLDRARKRVLIVRTMRRFLDDRGFFEVETPTLHSIAGGAAARPFVTHHNTLDIELYLRIALELHLKRLLVGGIEKVYEIGRVFRNEGISPRHNPEFTMMELYQAYGDYHSMMDLTQEMITACVEALGGGLQLPFGDHTIDFGRWERKTYSELFAEHVGVRMEDADVVRQKAEAEGFPTAGKHPDVVVSHLFEEHVEDKLIGPVFVYDYPASLCPLTKRKRSDPNIAERFELFVRGMELANAYTELNDPITQEATFRTQLAGLPADDSMAKMDDDFVRALRHGMPPAGGLGVGVDRLTMLLTNTQTIRDVILFPLLRPEKK
jgi:lysyl-tRNA synthetase class 2